MTLRKADAEDEAINGRLMSWRGEMSLLPHVHFMRIRFVLNQTRSRRSGAFEFCLLNPSEEPSQVAWSNAQ